MSFSLNNLATDLVILGMEVRVPLWQWIVAQVIMLVCLGGVIYGWKIKEKKPLLILITASSALMIVGFSLLQNWIMIGFMGVVILRNLIVLYADSKKDSNPKAKYILMIGLIVVQIAVSLAVMFLTEWWWLDFVLIAAAVFKIWAFFMPTAHFMRGSLFLYSAVAIVNHIVFTNVAGIVMESAIMLAVIAFYIKYLIEKAKTKEEIENTKEEEVIENDTETD